MKRTKVHFFFAAISLLLIFASCKNSTNKGTSSGSDAAAGTEEPAASGDSKVNTSGIIHASDIEKILPKAQARGKEKNDKAWAMVTADMWQYDFAITPEGSPKKNIFEGQWIDFKDDFSYVKGMYQDTTEAGYYIFDFDNDKHLDIIPLIGGGGASSWRLMTNGEVTIMIGRAKYGNKGWQIKLVRSHAKPDKAG